MSSLQDGRLVIQGGSDANAVTTYNPASNTFVRSADMYVDIV